MPRGIALVLLIVAIECLAAGMPQPHVTQRFAPLGSPTSTTAPDAVDGSAPTYLYYGSHDSNNNEMYLNAGSAQASDGHIYTSLVCDDLTYETATMPAGFTHYVVNDINFESINMNTTDDVKQVGVVYAFYDASGANGGPGRLLYREGVIGNFQLAGFYGYEIEWTVYSPPLFSLSPSTTPTIWACVFFDNLGDPSINKIYMDKLGGVVNDNGRTGTSQDRFFVSNFALGSACPNDNIRGTQISSNGMTQLPFNLNFVLQQKLWDAQTLWFDNFDIKTCGIPYFHTSP